MTVLRAAGPLALASLLFPLTAPAAAGTPVPFETVARGAEGPFGPPAEHVVRDLAALEALQVDAWGAEARRVDFARDMLIVVTQGTVTRGRTATEVTAIERREGPSGPELVVRVHHRRPAADELAEQVFTAPYHAVRLAASDAPVRFEVELERRAAPVAQGLRARVVYEHPDEPLVLVDPAGRRFRVTGEERRWFYRFRGAWVRIRGEPTPRDAPHGAQGRRFDLTLTEVLSPRPVRLRAVVRRGVRRDDRTDRARLELDATFHPVPPPVPAWGTAASVLTRTFDRRVEVEGYLFTDNAGAPRGVYVAAVIARRDRRGPFGPERLRVLGQTWRDGGAWVEDRSGQRRSVPWEELHLAPPQRAMQPVEAEPFEGAAPPARGSSGGLIGGLRPGG